MRLFFLFSQIVNVKLVNISASTPPLQETNETGKFQDNIFNIHPIVYSGVSPLFNEFEMLEDIEAPKNCQSKSDVKILVIICNHRKKILIVYLSEDSDDSYNKIVLKETNMAINGLTMLANCMRFIQKKRASSDALFFFEKELLRKGTVSHIRRV